MSLNWILGPAALYGAMALVLLGSLMVFVCMKREMTRIRRMAEQSRSGLTETVESLTAELQGIQKTVKTLEPVAGQPPSCELSLSRRANALRMHRRGESSASIAAAVQAPQNEIDLLLKVHRLLNAERS
ncbi:MAG TPA: hypothetical protein VFE22_08470 [Edaphobacter sp.]|nr:hypothetical protein [Edaphobacter sp.]